MIFTKWSARIRTAEADDYVAYVEETGGEHYAETEGNLGYQILLRDLGDDSSEITTISWWTDLDAVRRFAGDDYNIPRYYPEDDQYSFERPAFVEPHEVRDSDLTRFRK